MFNYEVLNRLDNSQPQREANYVHIIECSRIDQLSFRFFWKQVQIHLFPFKPLTYLSSEKAAAAFWKLDVSDSSRL